MGREYEAKFLEVDVAKVRAKLLAVGAVRDHPMSRMIRKAYNHCNGENKKAFVRVRQQPNGVTMTSKIMDSDFPQEFEVSINESFEQGVEFLDSLDIPGTSLQETYREKYTFPTRPDVHEVVFDMVPGIPTYMEIDCVTEDALNGTIKELELDESKKEFGAFAKQYEDYYGVSQDTINKGDTPSITFANVHNEIHPTKNREMLLEVQKRQLEEIAGLSRLGRARTKRKRTRMRRERTRTKRTRRRRK